VRRALWIIINVSAIGMPILNLHMEIGIVGLVSAILKRSKVLESKHNLIKKIEKLEYENNILKSEKELLQYQLARATNDLVRKDLKIKEMEHGRTDKSK